jgi:hypothetical protein
MQVKKHKTKNLSILNIHLKKLKCYFNYIFFIFHSLIYYLFIPPDMHEILIKNRFNSSVNKNNIGARNSFWRLRLELSTAGMGKTCS